MPRQILLLFIVYLYASFPYSWCQNQNEFQQLTAEITAYKKEMLEIRNAVGREMEQFCVSPSASHIAKLKIKLVEKISSHKRWLENIQALEIQGKWNDAANMEEIGKKLRKEIEDDQENLLEFVASEAIFQEYKDSQKTLKNLSSRCQDIETRMSWWERRILDPNAWEAKQADWQTRLDSCKKLADVVSISSQSKASPGFLRRVTRLTEMQKIVEQDLQEAATIAQDQIEYAQQALGRKDGIQAWRALYEQISNLAASMQEIERHRFLVEGNLRLLPSMLQNPRILRLQGQVFLKSKGENSVLLSSPIELRRSDSLWTEENSIALIEWEDGTSSLLEANAKLEITMDGMRKLVSGNILLLAASSIPWDVPFVQICPNLGCAMEVKIGQKDVACFVLQGECMIKDSLSRQSLTIGSGYFAVFSKGSFPKKTKPIQEK